MLRIALVFVALIGAITCAEITETLVISPVQTRNGLLYSLTRADKTEVVGLGTPAATDALVGNAQYIQDPLPANPTIYTVNLNYPQNGQGANITAVECRLVTDDTARNTVSVLSGGLNQRAMTLRIVSEFTRKFQHFTRIWGN